LVDADADFTDSFFWNRSGLVAKREVLGHHHLCVADAALSFLAISTDLNSCGDSGVPRSPRALTLFIISVDVWRYRHKGEQTFTGSSEHQIPLTELYLSDLRRKRSAQSEFSI
jgi:hypothetical protein